MKKRTALLALLLLTACDGGQPVDNKKILDSMAGPKIPSVQDSLKDEAKRAEDQGNYKQAAVYWQQLLEKYPDNSEVAFALAEAVRRGGDPDKAITLYDQLIAKDPTDMSAKESKALALIAKGDFVAPTPLLEEVMKAEPGRWKTLNALGILFSTRNLQSDAQQYFNAALKVRPASPSIYNNLGLSQALSKNFDAAIISLRKGSGLSAANSNEKKRIDLNLALVYASAGKLDAAKTIAQNYLEGASLDNNLGLYAHLAKDDQMARSYLNMALTESKTYYAKAWDNLQDISATGNDNTTPATVKKAKSRTNPDKGSETVPPDLFPSAPVTPPVEEPPASVIPPGMPSTSVPSTQMPSTGMPTDK